MFETLEEALKHADELESAKLNEPDVEEEMLSTSTPNYIPVFVGLRVHTFNTSNSFGDASYLGYLPSEDEGSEQH